MKEPPVSGSTGKQDKSSSQSIFAAIRDWLQSLGGDRDPEEGGLRESLEEVLEGHADDATEIKREEREMLLNILEFGRKTVDDVMVPRTDIVALEASAGYDEVIDCFRVQAHSRIPVYRHKLDNIIGTIHIKDVIRYTGRAEAFRLSSILVTPWFVPPSMPALDLLIQMRLRRRHLAIVVDEYGGTDGLVTIEDVVEEIVGDIQDEHDREETPDLKMMPDGTITADARAEIEALEDCLGMNLHDEEEDDIDTLGGLVFTLAGRVPARGEIITHPKGLEFEVTEAEPRRIRKLRIRHTGAADTADGSSSAAP